MQVATLFVHLLPDFPYRRTVHSAVQIGFDDFEDGVQFISAKSNSKINLIVTRDKKGFKKSDIAIADANQAMQYILAS